MSCYFNLIFLLKTFTYVNIDLSEISESQHSYYSISLINSQI